MPSVLFLFHRCIHCLGEFLVQGFDHSEASVAFRIGSAFRATVTDTVSGEFGYASVQGPVRAKRYGNQLEFAQSDKILAGDVFPSENLFPTNRNCSRCCSSFRRSSPLSYSSRA